MGSYGCPRGLRASQHSTEVIVRIMGQSWGVIRRLGWFRSFWRVSGSPIKALARGKTGFGGLWRSLEGPAGYQRIFVIFVRVTIDQGDC